MCYMCVDNDGCKHQPKSDNNSQEILCLLHVYILIIIGKVG
jgi:hypothetical protein